jgi:hypothetical protein
MRHGAKVKRCSSEGCTNKAKRGGVCIRHGAKKGGTRAHQNPNEREHNSLNKLNAPEANAMKATLRDEREELEVQRESPSLGEVGEADSDEASTAVEIVGKGDESSVQGFLEEEMDDRVVDEEEPLTVDPAADAVLDGLAERRYDIQEAEKRRLQSEIERYKKENKSLKEENGAVKASLMNVQEDLEDSNKLVTQLTLATDIWQGRFDEVSELARAPVPVDENELLEIRNRPLSSGR